MDVNLKLVSKYHKENLGWLFSKDTCCVSLNLASSTAEPWLEQSITSTFIASLNICFESVVTERWNCYILKRLVLKTTFISPLKSLL